MQRRMCLAEVLARLSHAEELSSAATRVAATQPMLQRIVAATHVAATRKLRQRMLQATRQVAGNAGPVSATRGQLQQRLLQQRKPVAGNASRYAACHGRGPQKGRLGTIRGPYVRKSSIPVCLAPWKPYKSSLTRPLGKDTGGPPRQPLGK